MSSFSICQINKLFFIF